MCWTFSDPSFVEFFATELDVDIDDPIYAEHGGSKGKRLRNVGEQIDGSFLLGEETYLMELKWHSFPTGVRRGRR